MSLTLFIRSFKAPCKCTYNIPSQIITVMSNLLEVSNEPGVRSLQQREESSTFSQEVLNTAETFGLYLAMFLEGSGMDGLVITTNNIGMNMMALYSVCVCDIPMNNCKLCMAHTIMCMYVLHLSTCTVY